MNGPNKKESNINGGKTKMNSSVVFSGPVIFNGGINVIAPGMTMMNKSVVFSAPVTFNGGNNVIAPTFDGAGLISPSDESQPACFGISG